MQLKSFIAGTIVVVILTVSAVRLLSQSAPKPENRTSTPVLANINAAAAEKPFDDHTCDHVMSYEPFRMSYEQCLARTKSVNMFCGLLAREHLPMMTTPEEEEKFVNILMVCPIAMLLNYPITISDGVIEVDVP